LNKEKEASLSEILQKISILDIEILPEGSEEEETTKLERQIAFLQKEVRQAKHVIEMKDSELVELQEKSE
jgi:hypothetical protein